MSKWISVDKKMPEDGVYVLCTDEDVTKLLPASDEVYTAAWDDGQSFWTTEYWGDYDFMNKVNPKFWAYLPDAPDEP